MTINSVWEDSSVIEIRASARSKRFHGTADIYINLEQLSDAAEQLRGFPTSRADVREIEWGDFAKNAACGALRLKFFCVDGRGHAQVEVEIQSDSRFGPVESGHVFIPLEPAAVDTFVEDLIRLAVDRSQTATLTSSEPATSY